MQRTAHQDLADTGEPMTEEHKVNELLNHIESSVLSIATATVIATVTLRSSFELPANFMDDFPKGSPLSLPMLMPVT